MPRVIFLAGPNGAGKSTLLRALEPLGMETVLADPLAESYRRAGLPNVEANLRAGRDVVTRMNELQATRQSFLHETNLVSRSLMTRLSSLRRDGYVSEVLFVGLRHADLAVERVAARVRMGGHCVDESTIRRRWGAGLTSFLTYYRYQVDRWQMYDNEDRMTLVATGGRFRPLVPSRQDIWEEYLAILRAIGAEGGSEGRDDGEPSLI